MYLQKLMFKNYSVKYIHYTFNVFNVCMYMCMNDIV